MILASLIWAAADWVWWICAVLAIAALVSLGFAYLRGSSAPAVRSVAAVLKAAAYVALFVCLLEPCWSGLRPRPGANLLVVLADNSQSLQIYDGGAATSRGRELKRLLTEESDWQTRLGQHFDVRNYCFDTRLQGVDDYSVLAFDGSGSCLATSLETIERRFRGRPFAGLLLLTDGIATDLDEQTFDTSRLPPVYPVLVGDGVPDKDVSVNRVSVSQTNFEAAPVTVVAELIAQGFDKEPVVVQLLDESGKHLQQEVVSDIEPQKPFVVRFQLQPERAGVSFYRVRAFAESERDLFGADPEATEDDQTAADSREATLANNSRLVLVDRGGGPYRVLYVSGRPNWDFKFLRRAVEEDAEVNLIGLVRIAKREPKFDFRSHRDESTNPLFRGFGNKDDETAEQYDEPVLLRLGTLDSEELRGGFPKNADELYRYDALILDDLESEYFTQDQMLLLQKFVSHRGGGFLMMGGSGSFAQGRYDRTPIGELLPVYLQRLPDTASDRRFRLSLTQEGWIQEWVRVRATEQDEQSRLNSMPEFETLNRVHGIKPGATVLATATQPDGDTRPALVTQRFGRGRAAALLIGDMWRWAMEQDESDRQKDLEKAWRQTVRWLVADVPRRIELETHKQQDDPHQAIQLTARVRDAEYEPLDNASVIVKVAAPDGKQVELTADPSDREAGVYQTTYVSRQPGAYRAEVKVAAADGSDVGRRATGWTAEPETEEFRTLEPNRAFLERLASETGGEVVAMADLDRFVASLPSRKVPITEEWVYPLWHHWTVLSFAMLCLTCEWGLRRWKGLP